LPVSRRSKRLDHYDLSFATGAPIEQIMEVASLAFIRRDENVILLSDRRGVGKTHLVIALDYIATRQGYRPRFFTTPM
jgi:DNA replication protein DnaC